MLVVISDLHFVDGTSGKHNLPAAAFTKVFKSALVETAKNIDAKEIKIVLLGDIVDLVRSTHWLEVPLAQRPWGEEGLVDVANYRDLASNEQQRPTEKICLRVLGQLPDSGRKEDVVHKDTILYQNWETFAFFRELPRTIHRYRELRKLPVKVIYVPGNHDRLCNLYPSVRDELAQILGLTVEASTVDGHHQAEWWYRYTFIDETYGILARHGHQYDRANYAGRTQSVNYERRDDNLQLPIGEVLTTEFAVRLPWEAAKPQQQIDNEIVERLQDIDNVRPMSRILDWLYWKLESDTAISSVDDKLEQILDDIVKNLLNIEFVRQWSSPDWHLDEVTRALARPAISRLLNRFIDQTATTTILRFILPFIGSEQSDGDDDFVQAAFMEPLWQQDPRIRFVLYGHTHHPKLRPLLSDGEREVTYINTGTWRSRIHSTVNLNKKGGFVALKHLTHVFFYGPDEDGGGPNGNKIPGTVSYDVWNGQMRKQYKDDMN